MEYASVNCNLHSKMQLTLAYCLKGLMSYIPRQLVPPTESYFLLGPRGVGKSTWLLHNYKDAIRLDFLESETERKYSSYPEKIRDLVHGLSPGSVVILDEIQRVPRLLPEIHALIEKKLQIQFIMTGSSTRKLRRAVSDLLGGRALMMQLGPFLASELQTQFNFDAALKTGLIPLIFESIHPQS